MTLTPRPSVLILDLSQEQFLYSCYAQLMNSMGACATVTQVETKGEFAREMKLSPPTIVIAIDAGISEPENAVVLQRLLQYTREGGTTVCCCNFSGAIHNARVKTFFATWGLPWDLGSYFRTTVHLNHAATGVQLDGLPEYYSLKSMTLLNVARSHRIYTPSSTSHVESNVFGPNEIPIDVNECPCAYGPVGQGWLGYVGDVNNEDGSTRVVTAMTRCLPQSAVVPDKSDRTYSFFLSAEGRPTKVQGAQHPNKPVMFTDTIRQAGHAEYITGHRRGRAGERSGTPQISQAEGQKSTSSTAASPQSGNHRRCPPRPREDEVETRAAKRAVMSKQKSEQAKTFKEQGNAYFRQGKYERAIQYYQKAISVHGPRPTYYANVAAAWLKLGFYQQAEEASSEALEYDPKCIKARYRRGVARRSMFAFKSAIEGRACAKLAPHDPQFEKEIEQTRKESDQRRAAGIPDQFEEEPQYLSDDNDDDCPFFDPPLDFPEQPVQSDSDSSDYEHEGNGEPCRAYNHEGRSLRSNCVFKHGPEDDTTRDQLGRNVCLVDSCTSGSSCAYAHSKEYLLEAGWWNEKGMLEAMELIRDYRNMTPEEMYRFENRI
ncbi:uncharacterized protein EV420DRAFT_1767070 [Desarmillaria tabescens]|uniref:TPR-like protein n=1 Tax=Armillaria tabescens TaxID=1929756 RepID=A0AA39JYP0_ARMTA|nr:uncharacterized protein EV420DRAFT_1767070 [Desarmillaria tabescens]KAK0449008.1 hypothetical protein EV420DRAFT_1767070 [Desarmillaria tabescens]